MSRRTSQATKLSHVYQPNEQVMRAFKGSESLTEDRFIQRLERNLDQEAQHGSRVHILMENGKPVDKWIDLQSVEHRKPWRLNYPLKGMSGI